MLTGNALLKRWLVRLLDEETPQANGMLREGDSFCCLGDLLDCSEDPKLTGIGDRSTFLYQYEGKEYREFLPTSFLENAKWPTVKHLDSTNLEYYLKGLTPLSSDSRTAGIYTKYLSPADLNDSEVPKSTIGMLIWAIIPLGQDMTETPLRKKIIELFNQCINNEEVTHVFENNSDLIPQVLSEVNKIND